MEVIERDEYGVPEICKKCGHYNDCPEFYICPPLSILIDFDIVLYHNRKQKA